MELWDLKKRLLVMLLAGVVVIVAIMAALRLWMIEPALTSLEQDSAQKDLGRISAILDQQAYAIDLICADWAQWDDMYEYLTQPNERFFNATLTPEAASVLRMDVFYLFTRDGKLRESYSYREGVPSAEALTHLLRPDQPFYQSLITPLLESGLVQSSQRLLIAVNGSPMLLVARPILRSDGSGPSNGVLVMGMFYSEPVIERLRDIAKLDFSLLSTEQLASRIQNNYESQTTHALSRLGKGNNISESKDALVAWMPIHHFGSEPIFVFFESPRALQVNARRNLNVALASWIGTLLIFGVVIYRSFSVSVMHPLREMTEMMQNLEQNTSLDHRLTPHGSKETRMLMTSFNDLLDEVAEQRMAIEQLSLTDALTGIPNRRQFEQVVAREWQHAIRLKHPLCFMLVDIDHFKHFNDHYGHQAGDVCLNQVAGVLSASLKRVTDFVARWGGEEFVIVLPNTDRKGALATAQRIIDDMARVAIPHAQSTTAAHVTVSIGMVCQLPGEGQFIEQWLSAADEALYAAKNKGRNQLVLGNV